MRDIFRSINQKLIYPNVTDNFKLFLGHSDYAAGSTWTQITDVPVAKSPAFSIKLENMGNGIPYARTFSNNKGLISFRDDSNNCLAEAWFVDEPIYGIGDTILHCTQKIIHKVKPGNLIFVFNYSKLKGDLFNKKCIFRFTGKSPLYTDKKLIRTCIKIYTNPILKDCMIMHLKKDSNTIGAIYFSCVEDRTIFELLYQQEL